MSARRPRPAAGALRLAESRFTNDDWMARGACRTVTGVDFFPNDGAGVLAAQRVCSGCPVRPACLEYALDNAISHGVWGGTSDRERQRLRSARSKAG